ncbi:interleukin-12 subunit alpha [Talpa occidentalis]|uniref:interleukin-12 subunit alpha n=1 Tax=Talpa occidentalis TaxID=50954 RepID=UPI001890979A|nr:interleukin-12 subunit alpha [Talpa occidentalis]
MCPPRNLLLVAFLSSLVHASLARSLPTTTTKPGTTRCLTLSQSLLQAVSNMLGEARKTLENYSCTPEEIDHVDITKDKTGTVEACLPPELTSIESCLPSRNASFIMTRCRRSIYEDLKMYQMEFQAVNETLSMDPNGQIVLDQNLLAAIEEMMQALNFSSEPPELEQKPSDEEPDFYRAKIKLCILLHAFRIRAVTINRMMSYMSS